ncbi:hypothetical protein [Erythrobacter sp. F6033]|uniref:hypothetical protein n=1 Tax=Erythrobacter sp. F6033 TaxID=2926401 RepID=UPI001FF43DD1|nr:hypothetical protein [Erythrobacter sp. F6033]MCK0129471.1 hypothetical protein [Erythrobacter sp. F6033]
MFQSLTVLAALAQVTAATADAPQTAVDAFTGLEGNWQGQLEYRDYQSDTMQAIPMRVEFDTIPDKTTFLQRAEFTDPGFPVRITTLINVAGADTNVAISRAGRPFETYTQNARLAPGAIADSWTITFTRVGEDDNRPAAIREVMTRKAESLTVTKEVDFLDDEAAEWVFRNRVSLSSE